MNTWIPMRVMGLWMLGSMEGIVGGLSLLNGAGLLV